MSKPEQPAPPNPQATAQAATGTNIGTAIANAAMNNMNQVTPDGTQTYNQTGTYNYTDPYTGQTYAIPQYTQTQTLSPAQQALKAQGDATKLNLATMGNEQSAKLSDWLSSPFSIAGAPAAGDPNAISGVPSASTTFGDAGQQQTSLGDTGQQQTTLGPYGQQQTSLAPYGNVQGSLGNTGQQQTTFDQTGDITQSYGAGDFSADRQNVQDSLMARINPQLSLEKQKLEQQLADQGIRYGSQAYNNAMLPYNQQANDARFSAISQAGTEQQRMMDMAAQRAGFQNAAQQQAYNQAQGRGQFANTAQAQNFQQGLAAGQFANSAQQQQYGQALGAGQFANAAQQAQYGQALGAGQFANEAQAQAYQQALQSGQFANTAQQTQFGQEAQRGTFANSALEQRLAAAQAAFAAQNTGRANWLTEQYAQRNQPINEITSLMSGSQVSTPQFGQTPTSQIPTTDVAGLINNQFSQQASNYAQANQQYQSLMGGILGLGGKLGGAAIASDRDVKENIDRIGTVFAASDKDDRKQLPIYQYSYKDDPASTRHIGPMAQDVEKIEPRAVTEREGVKHIYPDLVMGSIMRAA
jgi:hypothetical protein